MLVNSVRLNYIFDTVMFYKVVLVISEVIRVCSQVNLVSLALVDGFAVLFRSFMTIASIPGRPRGW